jgi:hypothetical protein
MVDYLKLYSRNRTTKIALMGGSMCLSFFIFCFSSFASGPVTPQEVAKVYGIDRFHEIQELHYTFHVRKGDKEITRKWIWNPQTDRVTYEGLDPQGKRVVHSYDRKNLKEDSPEASRKIDHWFINDQYWLLFPLHLVWDKDAKITNDGEQDLPIPPGKGTRLTVTYPSTGGYTPGDIYELYIGPNKLVKQWIFRKGGSKSPTLIATWEQHTTFDPLVISMLHQDQHGKFRLWFTDVQVKLVGK